MKKFLFVALALLAVLSADAQRRYISVMWDTQTGLIYSDIAGIPLKTEYVPTGNELTGTTYWDADNHCLTTVYEWGALLQHGFELYTHGTDGGNNFPKGAPVSVTGVNGNRVALQLTDITSDNSRSYAGLLSTAPDSGNRLVTREGRINGIDTTGTPYGEIWEEGDEIYVSDTPGELTNVEPTHGDKMIIRVGIVTVKHAAEGQIELLRHVHEPLDSASDVLLTDLSSDDILVYNGTVWENTTLENAGIIPATFIVACSDETSDLGTGTSVVTFRAPYAFTLTEVRINTNTAPTGSTIEVDLNESGVSVLSTVVSIDASEKTSTTAAIPAVISDSAIADDAELTIDIDQVGSSTPGTGLKITLIGTRI